MTGWHKLLQRCMQAGLAMALSFALPALSFANILNTASVTFEDAAGTDYTLNSNEVTTVTPPVINSAATATGNVGVAFTYTVTATNSPTSFAQTGLPTGLNLNTTTGAISGTPTASGTFTVTLTATNQAGTS